MLFQKKFGWFMLNPWNYKWMLVRGSDVNPDFFVWYYFYLSEWGFPIGMVPGYAYPYPISIIGTSSLSLFALPSKLLGSVFNLEIFQYFGPWLFICCLLQGLTGWWLLRSIGVRNPVIRVVGALFFLLSPCFLDRRFHISLCGHWLVIGGLALFFSGRSWNMLALLASWTFASIIALLIHPYFLVFILGLGFASIWTTTRNNKVGMMLVAGGLQASILLLVMYLFGYFEMVKGEVRPAGFGYYSANLATFFNSLDKTNSPFSFPTATPGQYEGFAYLGLGGIGIFLFVVWYLFRQPGLRKELSARIGHNRALLMLASGLFLYALSNNLSIGTASTVIPLPGPLLDILSIFRSSGRFIWLPFYLFLATIFWAVDKIELRSFVLILILGPLYGLQVWDTWPQLKPDYKEIERIPAYLDLDLISAASQSSDLIICYPPYQRDLNHGDDVMDVLRVAAPQNKPTTTGLFPRIYEIKNNSFADTLDQLIKKQSFERFSRALWIISGEYIENFIPGSPDAINLYYHNGYGIALGKALPVPEGFKHFNNFQPVRDSSSHVAAWLAGRSWAYLLISVKDDAANQMDDRLKAYFREIGSMTIQGLDFREGWVAAFSKNGVLLEKNGTLEDIVSQTLKLENGDREIHLEITSAGESSGNFSSILLDGKEYSRNERGLNVVLLDEELRVMGSWTFDTYRSPYVWTGGTQ